MARIPYYDLSQAPESYTRLIAARPPLNLYRMLAHAGKTAEGFLALGSAILRENTLDAKLREIAILRTGILCGASYEVHQHRRVARRVGLSGDKIDALGKDADRSALDATETLVLEFTDQVVLHVKAPDAMFEALCAAAAWTGRRVGAGHRLLHAGQPLSGELRGRYRAAGGRRVALLRQSAVFACAWRHRGLARGGGRRDLAPETDLQSVGLLASCRVTDQMS